MMDVTIVKYASTVYILCQFKLKSGDYGICEENALFLSSVYASYIYCDGTLYQGLILLKVALNTITS
jgi:hypothetical protein